MGFNRQHMTTSRIDQGHNADRNTDQLYEPLRNVLEHPENAMQHSGYTPNAAQLSHVTHEYHTLTTNEAQRLVSTGLFRETTLTFPPIDLSNPQTIWKTLREVASW